MNLGKATISLTAALIQILIAVRDGGPLMRFKYGEFANFTVEQKTKVEIQTLISNGLSVNANLTTTTSDTNEIGDYASNTKFFVVKDLNTGSSGLGTNILVNVERINFEDGYKTLLYP